MESKFIKTPLPSEINIKCRGKKCKKVHTFINKMPVEFTCECGFIIVKNGKIFPKDIE